MKNLEGIEAVDRRGFMAYMSALGLGGTLLPGVLWARLQERGEITSEILADASAVAGLDFTEEERDLMVEGLTRNLEAYEALREFPISKSRDARRPVRSGSCWPRSPFGDASVPVH